MSSTSADEVAAAVDLPATAASESVAVAGGEPQLGPSAALDSSAPIDIDDGQLIPLMVEATGPPEAEVPPAPPPPPAAPPPPPPPPFDSKLR